MRAWLIAIATFVAITAPATAQQWKPGQIVLGSPSQIPTGFYRCRVNGGPNDKDYYDVTCIRWFLKADGTKNRWEDRTWVPGDWIKADDPSEQPDMQFARVKAEQQARDDAWAARERAKVQAPKTADRPGGAVRAGSYQCYGGPAGNLKINFTGPGSYTNDKGRPGAFTQAGPVITFTSGPWRGFYAYVYADGDVQLRTAPNRPSTMECDRK